MKEEKQPHDKSYKICGAKTRKGTSCLRPSGWGTEHPGQGKCKLHGGSSKGAPKENKNAIKTGEHESIIFDILEDDEKDLYYKVNVDRLVQVNDEIRLTDIRLRRMLVRIKELNENDYTVVSYTFGIDKGKPTDLKESSGTLGQIQAVEDAVTRVQAHKVKLIDLKHKLEQDLGINTDHKSSQIEKLKADAGKINAEINTESKATKITIVDRWVDKDD